ncbi:MAG: DNA-3-methyladenine glycosylase [Motilibacteraceae bacterium]
MPDVDAPLPRRFFDRSAVEVAPALLGRVLVVDGPTGPVAVRLTEVEAYSGQGEDPGSHAHRGRSNRNAVMFGPPGHLYVYFSYGMHWCMNLVCLPEGTASAVLLRAGEVVDGLDEARARRPTARSDRELARGPARLTMALGVDGAFYGLDACDPAGHVRVLHGRPAAPASVRSGPRVGVSGDGAPIPWRFWIDGDPTVSVYRAAAPRRRRGGSTS